MSDGQDVERLRQRVERLERLVLILAEALSRQGTMTDGNWGHAASRDDYRRVAKELKDAAEK